MVGFSSKFLCFVLMLFYFFGFENRFIYYVYDKERYIDVYLNLVFFLFYNYFLILNFKIEMRERERGGEGYVLVVVLYIKWLK